MIIMGAMAHKFDICPKMCYTGLIMTVAVNLNIDQPAVYILWMGEVCLYVGATRSFPRRMGSHWRKSSGDTKAAAATRIEVIFCDSLEEAYHLEQRKRREYKPLSPWERKVLVGDVRVPTDF